MPKETYAHVPLDADQLDVVAAALAMYEREMTRSAGPTSSSAAVAREAARQVRTARRSL